MDNKNELKINLDPRLDNNFNRQNPFINQKIIYKFLDASFEYSNNPNYVVNTELKKDFNETLPGIDIKDKYLPDNMGWYVYRIQRKVYTQELKDAYKNDLDAKIKTLPEDRLEIFNERQKRAVLIISLVNKVLLENGIEPRKAQEISFNSVSKALDKNPNLVLSSESDITQSEEMMNGLSSASKEFVQTKKDNDRFSNRTDLTEENSKELQAYIANQILFQFTAFQGSHIYDATHSSNAFPDLAMKEGGEAIATTSLSLKNNIKSLKNKEINPKKRKTPTPFDDILDQIRH